MLFFPPEKSLQIRGSRCDTDTRYRIKTNFMYVSCMVPNQSPEGGKTSLTKRRKDCARVIKEMQPHAMVPCSAETWLLQGQRVSSGRFLECFSYLQRFLMQQLTIWLLSCKTLAQARPRNLSHGRSS